MTANVRDLAIGYSGYCIPFDSGRMHTLLDWLLARMEQVGLPATHLTVRGPGFREGKFVEARLALRRLAKSGLDEVSYINISTAKPDWDGKVLWSRNQSSNAVLRRPSASSYGGEASWVLIPSDSDANFVRTEEFLTELATISGARYGYLFQMERTLDALEYPVGGNARHPSWTNEEGQNIGMWGVARSEIGDRTILRDVYPVNFLRGPYLDGQIEGKTLREWISLDPRRGTLDLLTEGVWRWQPVTENIPVIRERLFRAGMLFYWRHFDPAGPWSRFLGRSMPKGAEIPEMFQAEHYRGRNPCVVTG
jgi:hypothetical protein